jgi:hypothetical protein
MELIKIIEARKVLENLADAENIGAHLSYWMARFVAKTSGDQDFYTAEIHKILDKYAQKSEDNTLTVAAEHITEFNDAISALNKTDAEDPGIRFDLSELSADLKLSMKQIYPLLDFINENQ